MKMLVGLGAVAASAALAASASATESTIYPGVGIGKLKLGMTKPQVERILGPDHIVNAREGNYTELAWDFAAWTVGFVRGRVVFVGTTQRTQRTPERVGPSSTATQLIKTYPHGICGYSGEYLLYLLAHKGGTQTIYSIKDSMKVLSDGRTLFTPIVLDVWVRTRFKPLVEFAPGHPCAVDWQKPFIR